MAGRKEPLKPREVPKSRERQQPRLGLTEHRQRAKIALEEIAESTKISKRFLQAIEGGEYEQLPGGVFATSYIRQYAHAVGFDADIILEHYRDSTEAERQPPRTETKQGSGTHTQRWAKFFSLG
jgi:cytoskeletal protein RodZ